MLFLSRRFRGAGSLEASHETGNNIPAEMITTLCSHSAIPCPRRIRNSPIETANEPSDTIFLLYLLFSRRRFHLVFQRERAAELYD
jgi:hypothetical protein